LIFRADRATAREKGKPNKHPKKNVATALRVEAGFPLH
jgi:hypothetical protein